MHAKVLRLGEGDKITLFDELNNEYLVEVLRYHSKQKLEGKVLEVRESDVEMKVEVTLVLALSRSKNFELALQKCTELGMSKVIPIETERSILKVPEAMRKLERWEKILVNATKQSLRVDIPQVMQPLEFEQVFENYDVVAENTLFAALSDKNIPIKKQIESIDKDKEIFVFIGPEGGFTEQETALAIEKGITPVGLGRRTLRTETAAIYVVSVLSYELDS